MPSHPTQGEARGKSCPGGAGDRVENPTDAAGSSTFRERGILPGKGQKKKKYTPLEIQKRQRLDKHRNICTVPVESWWRWVRKRRASSDRVEIPIRRGFQVSVTADRETTSNSQEEHAYSCTATPPVPARPQLAGEGPVVHHPALLLAACPPELPPRRGAAGPPIHTHHAGAVLKISVTLFNIQESKVQQFYNVGKFNTYYINNIFTSEITRTVAFFFTNIN